MHRQIAIVMACSLGACASLPDVTYGYFPPTSLTTVALTQTIECSADQTALTISYAAPQVTTVNFADTSKGPYTLPLRKLDGALADTDFSVNLTDDGRLKSINASSTGQAQTVLTSAISLATTLAAVGASLPQRPKVLPECTFLKTWNGGKPVSLVYNGLIGLADEGRFGVELEPARDETSKKIYEALDANGKLPRLALEIVSRKELPPPAVYNGAPGDGDVSLTLTRTENVKFDIVANGATLASSSVVVPGNGTYRLPVPGAVLFGKQSFSLTLTDAGAVSSIDYGKLTGAAAPFNVAGSIASAFVPPVAAP